MYDRKFAQQGAKRGRKSSENRDFRALRRFRTCTLRMLATHRLHALTAEVIYDDKLQFGGRSKPMA